MLNAILAVVGFIALIVVTLWPLYVWEESRGKSRLKFWFSFALAVLAWAVVIDWIQKPDDKPCIRYETTYIYNAATKTTMPAKFCAQYGEWLHE